jgi:hypothetical protein
VKKGPDSVGQPGLVNLTARGHGGNGPAHDRSYLGRCQITATLPGNDRRKGCAFASLPPYRHHYGMTSHREECASDSNITRMNKTMTLDEMERTLARLDVMLGTLKRQLYKGIADPRATPQAIARYQRLRDELHVQIGLERIKRATYQSRARRLYS